MTPITITENVSLKPYNTFGINVSAKELVRITSVQALQLIIQQGKLSQQPFMILGGGSNVLFTKNFQGLVLKNEIKGKEILAEDADTVSLRVGGGENWHELVCYVLEKNWGGIENLSLIPGSVGAAPIQNIGAYGVELAEVFVQLEAVNLSTAQIEVFDHQACRFGYRDSVFKQENKGRYFITHVVLKLSKTPVINTSYGAIQDEMAKSNLQNPTIQDISRIVCEIRQRKLPNPDQVGNAGSFFKNPIINKSQFELLSQQYEAIPHYILTANTVKVPAAWLIQTCGWKGKEYGTYGVHKNQALVLVNLGGAKGKDILDLAERIQQSVWNIFQIQLEREVNVI